MAYVNKQNLSDFWTNAKRYIAARDADQCDWTSIPVNAPIYTFEAEPRTPVNPVVEFGFTETPPEEGDKSPSNPSTITGVDSITVTKHGKNLLPTNWVHETMAARGVTVTKNADGSLHLKGTVNPSYDAYLTFFNPSVNGVVPAVMTGGTTLTVSVYCIDSNVSCAIYDSNSPSSWGSPVQVYSGTSVTHTMQNEVKSAMFRILVTRGAVLDCDVKVQIEFGSVATAWEPPSDITTTVSLGETRYGGTLDLATGKMTVTHFYTNVNQFVSLTSATTYNDVVVVRFSCNYYSVESSSLVLYACDRFPSSKDAGNFEHVRQNNDTAVSASLYLAKSRLDLSGAADPSNPTDAEWLAAANAWVAEHPFKFVSRLKDPFTIDLDPQQLFSALSNSKVNTVFTDTGTITQLTYAKPAPRQEDVFRYANWHRTESAGAVACYPVPESDLHPVVNFSFTETPPASGDKGPSNPSTITGVNSVKVTKTNSNLIRQPYYHSSGRVNNGITWTVSADGSIFASGTSTSSSSTFNLQLTDNFLTQAMLIPRGSYHFSGCPTGGSGSTYRLDVAIYTPHASRVTKTADHGNGGTLVVTEPALCSFYCLINSNQTVSNLQFKPTLQLDGIDNSFEKSEQDVYAVNLNNTYYGGSIDLSTGLMTVTWGRKALTGNEAFGYDSASNETITLINGSFDIPNGVMSADQAVYTRFCSHYIYSSDTTLTNRFFTWGTTSRIYFRLPASEYPTKESFAEFLASEYAAGHPVTVVYKLNTPFTVQLTPQQLKALPALDKYSYRVNTLYTDADSIQVGYMKSPIKTEEEFNNAILALGGNL